MKKKIGISYTVTKYQHYRDWFNAKDLGDDLEKLELSFQKQNREDISKCSGFLLTGGIDIDPSFYNGTNDFANRPREFQPSRDSFEKEIFEYATQNRLPILGICRGLQLVNVLQGGKLLQDLGKANSIHKKELDDIDKRHEISVVAGTLLHEITKSDGRDVNSAHHQAPDPDKLGKNLMVSAYSKEDSIIEGIEYKDKTNKGFMLCVQWHPERMQDKENHPFSQNIKERFLEEIRKLK